MLAGAAAGEGVAGLYHNGIPAWTIDGTTLRGCLLRNTPGGNRAASGSDTGVHTQHYTLDAGRQVRSAPKGYPLRTARYAHTRLHARPLTSAAAIDGRMPERAQLASVAQRDAVIYVAKPDRHDTPAGNRSLVLRIQQATNDSQQLDVDLPFLRHRSLVSAEIVTALEAAAERSPVVSVSGTTASFAADRALWTVRVETRAAAPSSLR